jgi:hypothetical protein
MNKNKKTAKNPPTPKRLNYNHPMGYKVILERDKVGEGSTIYIKDIPEILCGTIRKEWPNTYYASSKMSSTVDGVLEKQFTDEVAAAKWLAEYTMDQRGGVI